jgi:hypothetical protein
MSMAQESKMKEAEEQDRPLNGGESFVPKKARGLALTEYSANTPPPTDQNHLLLPAAFLLPDGKPDVRCQRVMPMF